MRTVLIVNHKEKACGVHQYGEDIYNSLAKSKYTFKYAECSNEEELKRAVDQYHPRAILYNFYPYTMSWLCKDITTHYANLMQFGIFHEVTNEAADRLNGELFDYWLCPDPTLKTNNHYAIKTKRLIPHYINHFKEPELPTIGSFGFGYRDKGFEQIVRVVNDEFDEAIINLHIPRSDVVGTKIWSRDHPYWLERKLRKMVKKGITLNITTNFMNKQELLDFLAKNTTNCFFYDVKKYKGISSVIDSALAVHRPIAVTKCGMFRHLFSETSIFIEDNTLKSIIKRGKTPLLKFYAEWSEKQFILNYERILDQVLT
jgi:hypothetical protein